MKMPRAHPASIQQLPFHPKAQDTFDSLQNNIRDTNALTNRIYPIPHMLPLHEGLTLLLRQGEILHNYWLQDGLPLQDFRVSSARCLSLTKAMDITSKALQDIEHIHHNEDIMDLTVNPRNITETAQLRIRTIQLELESMAHSFSTQADALATRFPTLLRRLHTKCAREPGKKEEHKKWCEGLLPDDFPLMRKAHKHKRQTIMEEMARYWEENYWLQSLETAHRHLTGHEYCDIAPPRTSTRKNSIQDTRWINMADTSCKLTSAVRNVRVHLRKSFERSTIDHNGEDQAPHYLPPPSHKYKHPYKRTQEGKPLKNLQEVTKWIHRHMISGLKETRECGGLECQLIIPPRKRLLELLDMCKENDYLLRKTLVEGQALIRLPKRMWPTMTTNRKG